MKKTLLALGVVLFTAPAFASEPSAEGYKGVPWGITFARFQEIKNVSSAAPEPSRTIIPDAMNFTQDVAILLGVPVRSGSVLGALSYLETDLDLLPDKFTSVYLKEDDVYFVFYDGLLAIAFSELNSKDYTKYERILKAKYPVLKEIRKEIPPPQGDQGAEESLAGLRFGKANTNVWLVKDRYEGGGMALTSTFVLYASKTACKDIANAIHQSDKVKKEGAAAESQSAEQKELKKIE